MKARSTKNPTPEEILKFRKGAVIEACNRGFPTYAEDYASFCLIALLEKRFTQHKWMFVDFLRSIFGDMRNPKGMKKYRTTLSYENIEEYQISENTTHSFNWAEVLQGVKTDTAGRVAFLLTYQYGFSQQEIGILLDVGASRVSQILSTIYPQLKRFSFDPPKLQSIQRMAKEEDAS